MARLLTECELGNGERAAPTFEKFRFGDRAPLAVVTDLIDRAAIAFPQLAPVKETINGLSLIL